MKHVAQRLSFEMFREFLHWARGDFLFTDTGFYMCLGLHAWPINKAEHIQIKLYYFSRATLFRTVFEVHMFSANSIFSSNAACRGWSFVSFLITWHTVNTANLRKRTHAAENMLLSARFLLRNVCHAAAYGSKTVVFEDTPTEVVYNEKRLHFDP